MNDENQNLKSVLQELYEFNQSDITTEGKPISLADYQDLIYQYVEQLADIIGIELEG